ncbi:hypothetical protein EYF80_022962 [Liparis tanakae]|uniref:Uncharacterized protein n=1 Tax=Liparis tanakae TaxID=230148 RepID=A0A4Z2HPI3_9TELE|nr:hypothetical protein EYF80_022962 [Liparis tanakae]
MSRLTLNWVSITPVVLSRTRSTSVSVGTYAGDVMRVRLSKKLPHEEEEEEEEEEEGEEERERGRDRINKPADKLEIKRESVAPHQFLSASCCSGNALPVGRCTAPAPAPYFCRGVVFLLTTFLTNPHLFGENRAEQPPLHLLGTKHPRNTGTGQPTLIPSVSDHTAERRPLSPANWTPASPPRSVCFWYSLQRRVIELVLVSAGRRRPHALVGQQAGQGVAKERKQHLFLIKAAPTRQDRMGVDLREETETERGMDGGSGRSGRQDGREDASLNDRKVQEWVSVLEARWNVRGRPVMVGMQHKSNWQRRRKTRRREIKRRGFSHGAFRCFYRSLLRLEERWNMLFINEEEINHVFVYLGTACPGLLLLLCDFGTEAQSHPERSSQTPTPPPDPPNKRLGEVQTTREINPNRLSSAGETSKSVATVLPLRFKNLPYRLGAEPRGASKRLLLFLLLFLLLLPTQPRRWKKNCVYQDEQLRHRARSSLVSDAFALLLLLSPLHRLDHRHLLRLLLLVPGFKLQPGNTSMSTININMARAQRELRQRGVERRGRR